MASQNPWQDEHSTTSNQGNPYQAAAQEQGFQNHNPYQAYQDQTHPQHTHDEYSAPSHAPPGHSTQAPPQMQSHNPFATSTSTSNSTSDSAPWQSETPYELPNQHASGLAQHPPMPRSDFSAEAPPGLPPRRTGTELALPTGQDRSHQIEVMQSYEAAGRKDEHDQNVEILQREFPKLDGSLIAAIYGDSKSLSATREMLGELDRE
jgi:hypothetical protein